MRRFLLPKEVQRKEQDGKIILINPSVPSWIVTDQIGETMLTLFDGNNTVSDVLELSVSVFGEDNRVKIKTFVGNVIKSKLLEDVTPNLHIVHLSLSDSCNLSCKYCYAHERKEKGKERLSLDEYKVLIDDILRLNPHCSITLTGGEPLLNKSWFDIASYIKDKGADVDLLSNGTLFTEENITNIKSVFSSVRISIDGSNREIHALSRGDNYDKVEYAISLLEKYNIPYSLSMTVTKQNIHDVEAAAKKFGSRLNFAPFFPIKGDSISDMSITGKEYYNALKSASGVEPLSYCASSLANAQCQKCTKCAIGDGEISISATGDVYPCQLLHTPDFYAGNVREASIIDIYTKSEVLKKCKELSVDNIEGCKDCAIRYICGGACRARAYYECGDIRMNGDFCEYEKMAYYDGFVNLYKENILDSSEEKRIYTLVEFLEWSKSCKWIDKENRDSCNTYNKVYYRGQANSLWTLEPGVFRANKNGYHPPERDLLKQAEARLWTDLKDCKNNLEKIIKLQHYGLKTRLLDVTSNALVALFFACSDKEYMNSDGKVFYCCPKENNGLVVAKAIADIVMKDVEGSMGGYSEKTVLGICEKYYSEDPQSLKSTLSEAQFFFPAMDNDRIKAQRGAFLIAPLICKNQGKDCHDFLFTTSYYDFKNNFCGNVVIDAKSKQKILDELAEVGIDESSIYPDIVHTIKCINEGTYNLNKFSRDCKLDI